MLKLKIGNKTWARYLKFRQVADGKQIIRQRLIRDKFYCQFCGFKGEKYQQVMLKTNVMKFTKSLEDYTTCCLLCMQCQFLGAKAFGKIIYLPEMSQTKLNNFSRVLLIYMLGDGHTKETATELYRGLRLRTNVVEKSFGIGTSDSVKFGQLLSQAGLGNKPLTGASYSGLRLLPNKQYIEKALVYWKHLYSADIL